MTQEPPTHICGAKQDFCVYHDTKIYFCIICKKVLTAVREPEEFKITYSITMVDVPQDKEMNEYDDTNLEKWA